MDDKHSILFGPLAMIQHGTLLHRLFEQNVEVCGTEFGVYCQRRRRSHLENPSSSAKCRRAQEIITDFDLEFTPYSRLNERSNTVARRLYKVLAKSEDDVYASSKTTPSVQRRANSSPAAAEKERCGFHKLERFCGTASSRQDEIRATIGNNANLFSVSECKNLTEPTCISSGVIAVDVEPSSQMLVAVLAVLKLGFAYVPLDGQSAINRVRYILNESRPKCILADSHSAFLLDSTLSLDIRVIDIDSLEDNSCASNISNKNLSNEETFDDQPQLFAVIFTSGSTGRPKGVKIRHWTACNRIAWQWKAFPFVDGDVTCLKTSLLFVDSIVEIFGAILKPVSMVVARAGLTSNVGEFISWLDVHRVTRVVVVASLLRSILSYLDSLRRPEVKDKEPRTSLDSLRLWMSNSEPLSLNIAKLFFDVFPENRTLCNFYGSTETMADVTYAVFSSRADLDRQAHHHGDYVPIGVPMNNSAVYITNERLELTALGDVGEICVSGHHVTVDGYIDSAQNDGHFVPNPFPKLATRDQDVLYRTGDYGRTVESEGCRTILYEGRRDDQVKISGRKVNIAEIERVVSECPGVDRVVVLCHTLGVTQSSFIVAYYTVSPPFSLSASGLPVVAMSPSDPKIFTAAGHTADRRCLGEDEMIKQACCDSLPEYMQPKLLRVDYIPLQLHTGKIDRIALRDIFTKSLKRFCSHRIESLNASDVNKKALNIIALNLGLPPDSMPTDRSFFHLGGNSVAMVAAIVQLRENGFDISIDQFSTASTVQAIIDHVTNPTSSTARVAPRQMSQVYGSRGSRRYVVRALNSASGSEMCVQIMAASFSQKEPLAVLVGITEEQIKSFAADIYNEAVKEPLSLVVIDEETGEIIGGDFLFDFSNVKRYDVMKDYDFMQPIFSLIRLVEEPIRGHLAARNFCPVLYNFCLFVDTRLSPTEQVKICHVIETDVIRVAQSFGFAAVVTNNTNPATQDICQHFLGYEILSSYLVRDFEFNGRMVFSHAPDNFYIKMMIKDIK